MEKKIQSQQTICDVVKSNQLQNSGEKFSLERSPKQKLHFGTNQTQQTRHFVC